MIRKVTEADSIRIAEIDVTSERFAYKDIVPEEMLYKDFTVENRIPVVKKWIEEKYFDIYVYEDSESKIIKGKNRGYLEYVIWVLEENSIGINCYKKNGYSADGNSKIFQRFNKKEIRFVKL